MDRTLDRVPSLPDRRRQVEFNLADAIVGLTPRSYTWAVGQVLDQGREGACFTGDVHIRMADGSQKPIEQVRVLEEVVTAEGNTGTVTAVFARRYSGPLIRINAWGHSHLRCTPEHPILTKRGYVAAKDLEPGDFLALPRYIPKLTKIVDPAEHVDMMTLSRATRDVRTVTHHSPGWAANAGPRTTEVSLPPAVIDMTAGFGRLLGLYAAEGHTTANKVVWSYGGHEHETLAPETVRLVRETLGAEAHLQVRPNNSVNVVLYGKHWRLLFASLIPGTTKHGDKHLSAHVTSGDAEFLSAVLHGWYDGDGYVRVRNDHTSRDGVTVSQRLALDMHAIAVALGFRPAIVTSPPSMNRHAATRQDRWSVTMPATPVGEPDLRLGFCECGCGERTRMRRGTYGNINRFVTGHNSNVRHSEQTETHLWRKVREVTEEPNPEEYVFNLEVEGDHSYVAEGIGVHNCVGHGWTHEAVARPAVARFPRPAPDATQPLTPQQFAFALYAWCKDNDEWAGNNYDGTSVAAGAKGMARLGLIPEYRWTRNATDAAVAVSRTGPAVIGVDWYAGMFNADRDGYLNLTGQVQGGHCLLVNGYSVRRRAFHAHNSWGPDWGRNGGAWIRHDDMTQLLRDGGECCVPVRRSV